MRVQYVFIKAYLSANNFYYPLDNTYVCIFNALIKKIKMC